MIKRWNLLYFIEQKLSIPIFLIGHVTKSGDIAGPKILEHIVSNLIKKIKMKKAY